jgi:lactate dehydrogenase-like 2-hydroxyacid dehydrogenase
VPRPRVFVTRELPGDRIERLRQHADADVWPGEMPPPRDELLTKAGNVAGILTMLTDRIDQEFLDHAPTLRIVSNMAVGYDNIDVSACTHRGVLVTNTPGVLTETTADLALALMLAAARRLPDSERAARDGQWRTWHPSWMLGRDLHGTSLGIVGLGKIGLAVARRARGFGMRILYSGRAPKPDAEREVDARYVNLQELLAGSDFVSVHAPLTDETRHMFDDAAFARMKATAIFVNTARGGLVDEGALQRALESGQIAGAAIDVTEVEPLPLDSPLLSVPDLLITPHIGSATVATRTKMADLAVENLIAGLAGQRPPHPVNPEVLS